jgi:hypothetical protein
MGGCMGECCTIRCFPLHPLRSWQDRVSSHKARVDDREQQIGGSGGSLEPPGPLLEPPGPLLTHLHTFYMAYSECLPTRLNPLAERTCFYQVDEMKADACKALLSELRQQEPSAAASFRRPLLYFIRGSPHKIW